MVKRKMRTRLNRQAWVEAAKEAIAREGIAGVAGVLLPRARRDEGQFLLALREP
jgi:hypothetical protein